MKDVKIMDVNSLGDIVPMEWRCCAETSPSGPVITRPRSQSSGALLIWKTLCCTASRPNGSCSHGSTWGMPACRRQLQDAERVYREDLKRHRGNGWAVRGLEQTLRKQG